MSMTASVLSALITSDSPSTNLSYCRNSHMNVLHHTLPTHIHTPCLTLAQVLPQQLPTPTACLSSLEADMPPAAV